MKAIVQTAYGSPDYFELVEMEKPALKDHEVLLRVRAAAIHGGDIFFMKGIPYMVRFMAGFPKPKNYIPGYDVAGIVEAVGKSVTEFKAGDEVFGPGQRTCAEFTAVKEKNCLHKPVSISFEQAAAIPTSGLAALQGLVNIGKIEKGQKVLINGASGGVGTFAVQIAKAFGAEVTGVCSTKNLDLVRSIGADHVIDYTRTNFTQGEEQYDLILDQIANHSLAAFRGVLSSRGKYIPNSGNSGLGYILKALIVSLFNPKQKRTYLSVPNKRDMTTLKDLMESGKVNPVIDKQFKLGDISQAFLYMEEIHASGKVVIIL